MRKSLTPFLMVRLLSYQEYQSLCDRDSLQTHAVLCWASNTFQQTSLCFLKSHCPLEQQMLSNMKLFLSKPHTLPEHITRKHLFPILTNSGLKVSELALAARKARDTAQGLRKVVVSIHPCFTENLYQTEAGSDPFHFLKHQKVQTKFDWFSV